MTVLDPTEVFRTETVELFEQIESGLLDLTHDLSNKDMIDSVFRGLHTLKGSGAMFGFDQLASFTHHCETAFDRVRKGEAPATLELVTAVLNAQDHMRALVADPMGEYSAQSEILLASLQAAVGGQGAASAQKPVSTATAVPAKATQVPASKTWALNFTLPSNALVNGTQPLGLLDELRELGPCDIKADLSHVPALGDLNPVELHVRWSVNLTTSQPRSAIEDVFMFVIDDMDFELSEAGSEQADDLSLTKATEVDAPVSKAVSVPVSEAASDSRSSPAPSTAKENKSAYESRNAKVTENVRVPAERLDELMDRVGELVIAQSRLSQLAHASQNFELRSVSEDVERLSSELRDTMMVLRMVPVGSLFSRFRRLVHDLARETGKAIELSTEGETTEIDKTVIERLADPLVHLVRNSVDHGLEMPQDRLALGKDQTGKVTLSAHQAGGEVIITIKDDGRGINLEKVRAKAEASGLLAPGAAISDGDLCRLIFEPGFSTASQITNLSGRGVGMDVVKKTVEGLRGSIDVRNFPGQGSEVALRIPLTLAIIDGLLVRVGTGRYVIPLSAIEECLELSLDEDLRSRGRSFISLRDSLVPFVRLRELFNSGTQPELHQKMVVISTGSERVGLVVDQIIGDHQTVIKSMSKLHQDVTSFSGATILGDGSVALILDVGQLVATGQKREAQMRAAG